MINFEKKDRISIWVGLNPRPKKTDVLKVLCGIEYYDVDFQEYIPSDSGENVPIRSLLEQLGYAAVFIDKATEVANKMSLSTARWVLAQSDFAYDPTKVRKKIAPDPIFLGVFDWYPVPPAEIPNSQTR